MPNAAYQHIIDNRDQYGKVVHLRGDSISRGLALGQFEDGDDPLDPANPLYQLRSIASMANWALEINGRPERFAYAGGVDAEDIAFRIAQGTCKPGDTVVLEDAGFVTCGVAAYYAFLKDARVAAVQSGIPCVMMTMFDYLAAGFNEPAQFDLVHSNGPADSGTLNDAVRKAATVNADAVQPNGALSPTWARTHFIDMNAIMDSKRASALATDGVELMRNDGIHPNVWGQMRMVQQIMAACGLRQYITDVTPIQDLVAADYQFLGYGSQSPNWNANRARTYAAMLRAA